MHMASWSVSGLPSSGLICSSTWGSPPASPASQRRLPTAKAALQCGSRGRSSCRQSCVRVRSYQPRNAAASDARGSGGSHASNSSESGVEADACRSSRTQRFGSALRTYPHYAERIGAVKRIPFKDNLEQGDFFPKAVIGPQNDIQSTLNKHDPHVRPQFAPRYWTPP